MKLFLTILFFMAVLVGQADVVYAKTATSTEPTFSKWWAGVRESARNLYPTQSQSPAVAEEQVAAGIALNHFVNSQIQERTRDIQEQLQMLKDGELWSVPN